MQTSYGRKSSRATTKQRSLGIHIASAMFLLTVAACGTATIQNAQRISASGTALTTAIPDVYDASLLSTVSTQGGLLATNRVKKIEGQTNDELKKLRRDVFDKTRDAVQERHDILSDLRLHSQILRRYFSSLEALARSGEPEKFSESTGNIITALGAISPQIVNHRIGGVSIGSAAPDLVELVVSNSVAAKLGQRLKTDYPLVQRELALQEAALSLLALDIEDNSNTHRLNFVRTVVREPYATGTSLPKGWEAEWAKAYAPQPQVEAVSLASSAMRDLRRDYEALVTGEVSSASAGYLLEDISEIVSLIETAKGN